MAPDLQADARDLDSYRGLPLPAVLSRPSHMPLAALVFAVVGALAVMTIVSALTDRPPEAGLALFGFVGALVPIAIGIAVHRYQRQRTVDHRFHLARYDAERTVAGLATGLRDEVDVGRLRHDILEVVDWGMEPTEVDLWLRPGLAR